MYSRWRLLRVDPLTAEERQDRAEKRRKIDRDAKDNAQANSIKSSAANHSQLGAGNTHSGGIDYVEVKPLPSSSSAQVGPGGLPAKPTWSVEQEQAQPKADVSSMIGDNASIVANRRAIRMAGLKAEDTNHSLVLPGGGATSSGVSKEEKEEMEVEKQAEEKGAEEAKQSNADAAAALKAAMFASNDDDGDATIEEVSPRGTKRKASASAEGSTAPGSPIDEEAGERESEEKVNAFLADSLLPPKPATIAGVGSVVPPELKSMGNNQVEQEDTVKWVDDCSLLLLAQEEQ